MEVRDSPRPCWCPAGVCPLVDGTPRLCAGRALQRPKIHQVLLEPKDQPLSRDQIGQSLVIRPGDIFTEAKLGDAVRRLFTSGRYKDIQADVEDTPEGLILTFKTVPSYS